MSGRGLSTTTILLACAFFGVNAWLVLTGRAGFDPLGMRRQLVFSATTVERSAHVRETLQATVTIRNVGRSTVRLLGMRTSCACLAANLRFPQELTAGSSLNLNFEMFVGYPKEDGYFTQEAELFTDCKEAPPLIIFRTAVPLSERRPGLENSCPVPRK